MSLYEDVRHFQHALEADRVVREHYQGVVSADDLHEESNETVKHHRKGLEVAYLNYAVG